MEISHFPLQPLVNCREIQGKPVAAGFSLFNSLFFKFDLLLNSHLYQLWIIYQGLLLFLAAWK